MQNFNANKAAELIKADGYLCEVKDGAVIVQDPVHVSGGTAAGRFVEFKAVTLRSDADVRKFILDRS
jgi:hypothetical protein